MLGEIIAQEIRDIEDTKDCHCDLCMATKAVRAALVYRESLKCNCPVCTTSVFQLGRYIDAMDALITLAEQQEKEINEIKCKLIIVPEEQQYMRQQMLTREKNIAAASTLATTILNLIFDYKEMSNAAHFAYETIEHHTIDDLAKTAAEAISYITKPPQSLDVN